MQGTGGKVAQQQDPLVPTGLDVALLHAPVPGDDPAQDVALLHLLPGPENFRHDALGQQAAAHRTEVRSDHASCPADLMTGRTAGLGRMEHFCSPLTIPPSRSRHQLPDSLLIIFRAGLQTRHPVQGGSKFPVHETGGHPSLSEPFRLSRIKPLGGQFLCQQHGRAFSPGEIAENGSDLLRIVQFTQNHGRSPGGLLRVQLEDRRQRSRLEVSPRSNRRFENPDGLPAAE